MNQGSKRLGRAPALICADPALCMRLFIELVLDITEACCKRVRCSQESW